MTTERVATRVSDAEMTRRWDAVRKLMRERGIQALVAYHTEDWLGGHARWFTDIPTHNGYGRTVVFHADDLMTVVQQGNFGARRELAGKDTYHRGVGEIRLHAGACPEARGTAGPARRKIRTCVVMTVSRSRRIVLGKASQELKDNFAATVEAQDYSASLLKPDASCRDIAKAHDDFMKARGLPPETRLYSHGQGYDMVERPLIRVDEPMEIEPGMCLAVHPGFETPSLFVMVCDNYIVSGNSTDRIHKTERKIFEVVFVIPDAAARSESNACRFLDSGFALRRPGMSPPPSPAPPCLSRYCRNQTV